jgi:hypothetical protein
VPVQDTRLFIFHTTQYTAGHPTSMPNQEKGQESVCFPEEFDPFRDDEEER